MAISQNVEIHEWLTKSNFSFLMGSAHPHQLIQMALGCGYSSLCLNDFDGLYGTARLYNEKKSIFEKTGKTIKLNYGAEIHLLSDHHSPLLKQKTLVLNVFNKEGYTNLCKLLSLSHKESKTKAFLSLETLLTQDLSGLLPLCL